MIINRHNYEEFFLLYIDKELDKVQQIAVEEFVKQNPDLDKELDMLKQAILSNDAVRFEAKGLLYKVEAGISMANYQEYFLLSVDNELSREEFAEVEKFVLKHPQLQDEFTLLKQTILKPETIQFPKKEVLYQAEKKRRAIRFTIRKLSVAAGVAGLIAALWIFTQHNNAVPNNNNLAVNKQHRKIYSKPLIHLGSSDASINQPIAITNNKDKNDKIVEQPKKRFLSKRYIKRDAASENTIPGLKQNSKGTFPKDGLAVVQTQKKSEEKLPPTLHETPKNLSSNSSSETVSKNIPKATLALNRNVETEKPFAKEALFNEISNNDEDRSIYIGATEINKNKLKGFLKRAANLFDKKGSKSETERTVQIASFEIKSK